MTTIFSESVYEPKDKQSVKHYCDDGFSITKYNKEKTMNQMREMLYFSSENWCTNKGQLIKMFTDEKNSNEIEK